MAKCIHGLKVAMFVGYILAWSPAAVLAQGQDIYNDKCAICHGQGGTGNGPVGAVFSPSPTNFTNPGFWQGNVDQKIADAIENGHGPMPAFTLSSSQIRAVIAYMKQKFKP
jgi:mono/diheme cytochrome c family protein